ncbi:MAG: amino acid permease [Bryobacteraceae bacterium]|nr:amino acid permease [Bryobacteraceae bacterium]
MSEPTLHRRLNVLNATSINMSNMVGIGPFIAIPLILRTLEGPQSYLAWVVGVLIALSDGLVVAELGAALPAAGGTYVFLREGFGPRTWGRMLAFLFVWQLIFAGPLEIASGNIGLVQYLKVFWPAMTELQMKLAAGGVGVVLILALYRRITDIAKIMLGLWIVMIVTTGWVILTGILHFNPALAFDLPPDAWRFDLNFLQGLGQGTANVLYLFLGYYQVCYLGAEVKNPGRTIPRAVVYSIVGVTIIDVAISFGFIGVVPWREGMQSESIGAEFMSRAYGPWAGTVLAGMIVVTAFASVYALLLGYSRVPYAAAQDGVFLRWFSELHRTKEFPHRGLLLFGVGSIVASFFPLQDVILALMAARIVIQFNAQVIALFLIRAHRPDIQRPFHVWFYPLTPLISLVGYLYVFSSLGLRFILFGLLTLAIGAGVYFIVARQQREWPFEAKEAAPRL